MKRLMKILPICAAALLFSAAAPGIAAADHGRQGGHGKGQHHVVKQHKPSKHFGHHGRRQQRHARRHGHGHGYGHDRRRYSQGRRHYGQSRPYYVYLPYYGYRGYRY